MRHIFNFIEKNVRAVLLFCHKTTACPLHIQIINIRQFFPFGIMKRDKVLTIFTRNRHRLYAKARSIAGQDNADDILQDAFCKLWTLRNLPPDQQQTERMASTIVRNVSVDYWRHEEREGRPEEVKAENDDSIEQERRELFNTVKRIIESQLDERQRKVLWMRDYEGYSFAEVAETMCITEENARQILSRARKRVRETYKRIN